VRIVLWSSGTVNHPAQASTITPGIHRTSSIRLGRIFKCVE